MPLINFGEWAPDASDYGNPGAILCRNALPGVNSYLPWNQLVIETGTMTARPRGAIEAVDNADNRYQYAGDASKLYSLVSSAWTDVSVGGGYSTGTTERWEFAIFGQKVLATNFTDNPQQITMGGANFANLTTALRFRHLAVVRDFIVAGNTYDGTDGAVPDRVWWSAQGDETDWSPSTLTLSDFRDLAVGPIQAVVGGDYGVIVCTNSTFRMTFVGSPTVFQIDEVAPEIGAIAPGGVVRLGNDVFFPSEHGFIRISGGAQQSFIGAGRVDQFFADDLDLDYLDRVSSVSDPKSGRVYWAYPGAGNTGGRCNKVLVYDRALDRWGYAEIELELIFRAGGTGITLEGLDDLNLGTELVSNGDFSSDTIWTKGTGWTISGGTATHAAGTASSLSQTLSLSASEYYRIEFDVSGRTAGSVTPSLGGTAGTAISANATDIKESILTASGSDIDFACTSDFDGSIDNVSVKEIDDLDTMAVSLDSASYKGSATLLSAFDSTFASGSFSGAPYTAVFETRESRLNEGRKTKLKAFEAVVDGGSVTAQVGYRDSQGDTVTYTTTLTPRSTGYFSKRVNAAYHRFRLTVSGEWKDAIGVNVDGFRARTGGRRG